VVRDDLGVIERQVVEPLIEAPGIGVIAKS
jgi:hypothetical protein